MLRFQLRNTGNVVKTLLYLRIGFDFSRPELRAFADADSEMQRFESSPRPVRLYRADATRNAATSRHLAMLGRNDKLRRYRLSRTRGLHNEHALCLANPCHAKVGSLR